MMSDMTTLDALLDAFEMWNDIWISDKYSYNNCCANREEGSRESDHQFGCFRLTEQHLDLFSYDSSIIALPFDASPVAQVDRANTFQSIMDGKAVDVVRVETSSSNATRTEFSSMKRKFKAFEPKEKAQRSPKRPPRQRKGCDCQGCKREDCGGCQYCLDKRKFGGPQILRKRCQMRHCRKQ
eukprot:TRINITY_DN801_c0_g2_i1.p1 TRINITY_DN801_c0_g2~~TRINITY_DN801_c0_g2_i1.p1  ORF type:complete len:182 (+),score=26.74 TRINITY_DN801_c0_g2_i1:84-629(+)